jgi:TonB-dependent SusC/RagA subfamily outer membrane receptor
MTMFVRFFALAISLLSFTATQAQTEPRQVLEAVAGKLARSLQESGAYGIYLHHDKPWYQSGSTVWFRVYLYNPVSQQAVPVRDNVYVDLVSGDSVIHQVVLNSVNREWDGGMKLPPRLPEGYYTLRAYTLDIARQNPAAVFAQQIMVVSDKTGAMPSKTDAAGRPVKGEPTLHFFPEGGNLVNGLDNPVAVLATTPDGYPLSVEGTVLDDNNKRMADFKTDARGMGLFTFAPYKNRSYRADIKGPGGQSRSYKLPGINYRATQLMLVSQTEKSVKFRVALGDSIYAEKPPAYLLGSSRGQILFAAMGNGMFEIEVPLDKFPAGPASFHLYNKQQEEVSRRVVFIPTQKIQVKISPDKDNYATRQKAGVTIQVNDAEGKPVNALLSVSVTDDRMVDWGTRRPGWYASTDPATLLRASAQPIAGPLGGSPASGDTSLRISGRLLDRSGNPAAGQVITILAEGTSLVLSDTSGPDGRFAFPSMEFSDESPFLAQVRDPQGTRKGLTVVTDQALTPPVQTPFVEEASWMSESAALKSFRLQEADSVITGTTHTMLEAIVIQGTKTKKGKAAEATRSASTRVITGEQLDKLGLGTTVQAVMMMPGVIMVGNQLTIRGGTQGLGGSGGSLEPLLLIDGVPSGGGSITSQLNSINPKLIESIEVVTGGEAARYGTRAANGVILVKTANQMRPDAATDERGMQYIFPRGYHLKPDFYAPPYEAYGVREATFTDNRSTIHWIGELATDKSGKAEFSFYTADLKATYTVRVVGITSKGDLIDESIRINRQ